MCSAVKEYAHSSDPHSTKSNRFLTNMNPYKYFFGENYRKQRRVKLFPQCVPKYSNVEWSPISRGVPRNPPRIPQGENKKIELIARHFFLNNLKKKDCKHGKS